MVNQVDPIFALGVGVTHRRIARHERRDGRIFKCYTCGQVWAARPDQSIVQAQDEHAITHPLAMRLAIETLVRGFDSGVAVIVSPDPRPVGGGDNGMHPAGRSNGLVNDAGHR